MTQITRIALFLALLAGTLAPALAQNIRKVPDVNVERELVVDADGLKQFAELDLPECPECHGRKVWDCRMCKDIELPNCPECEGTKKAPCRQCCGAGHLMDPIEAMHCPMCYAAGWVPCEQCGGRGWFGTTDANGNEARIKCIGCKEAGFFQCTVCEGQQKVVPPEVKRKPIAEARAKDLRAALETLTEFEAELAPWEPDERASKSNKALEKMFKGPAKVLPALERFLELQETIEGALTKAGASYQNYPARLTNLYLNNRNRMVHLVRYQKRVFELYLERAEFNENVK